MVVNRAGWFPNKSDQTRASSQAPPAQVAQSPASESSGSRAPVMDGRNVTSAAASVSLADDHRRVSNQRNRTSNVAAKAANVSSKDFALQPAPVFTQKAADQNAAEISLSKPFEFSLQDSRGVTHKISLPPVSFGSQQLMQNGQRFQPATYSANRVW